MSEQNRNQRFDVEAVLLQAQFEHANHRPQMSSDADFHINHMPGEAGKSTSSLHIPGIHGLGNLIRRIKHSPSNEQMLKGSKEFGDSLRADGNSARILQADDKS